MDGLAGASADLAVVFCSPEHAAAEGAWTRLRARVPGAVVVGCSAESCIGGGVEVEEGPGLALALAHLPGVAVHPFPLTPEAVSAAGGDPARWRSLVGIDPAATPAFVLLGDPFTGDTEAVLRGLSLAYPVAALVGGLASGGQQVGENLLILGERSASAGYVGLALHGDVVVDTIVAQGCRPIGEPMFVTRCAENMIYELDGRPPLELLSELVAASTDRELALFETSLFVGVQMDAARAELGRGDFLVRNVVGADRDAGALAIGARVSEGQVVQFQLRDGDAASEDLQTRLEDHTARQPAAEAALLFSCLGRGRVMYGLPNHDSDALRRHLGDIPVAGFFGNGEIGPVEGQPFLHGYTSAIAIFRRRDASRTR